MSGGEPHFECRSSLSSLNFWASEGLLAGEFSLDHLGDIISAGRRGEWFFTTEDNMKLFHRTPRAGDILAGGFSDNTTTRAIRHGVWLSDAPLEQQDALIIVKAAVHSGSH